MDAVGNHLIVELYGCNSTIINDEKRIEEILVQSANIANVHIINSTFHQFNPQGISGVLVIAESHFSIHTWPEYSYCALDIFTCGNVFNIDKSLDFIKNAIQSTSISVTELKRGVKNFLQ
jgi:S-adenosylmethionine decarboxylase